MFSLSLITFVLVLLCITSSTYSIRRRHKNEHPTVYDYFTGCGITSGLKAKKDAFKLNGKNITIISGSIHYFRVHPKYWRDRMKKLRALGANTLDTYVPWNLHEPTKGTFDFGGEPDANEMSKFLDLQKFLEMAKEEDLLVLLRPGPYICAEWEFGGFPSWLLRDPNMKVRTNYEPYLKRVKVFFNKLLPMLVNNQFVHGGSIIGIQVENEYGSFNKRSKKYLEFLYNLYVEHGLEENTLLYTSDGAKSSTKGTLPDKLLLTVNFQRSVDSSFQLLKEIQPNKPVMAMEFWSGWFDLWGDKTHNTTFQPSEYAKVLEGILGKKWNGSVNFYMFHGGTNFAFMAGALKKTKDPPYYAPIVTSYDYNALLTEAGDYTEKFKRSRDLIEQYQVPKIKRTKMVQESTKTAYPSVEMQLYLSYDQIIEQVPATAKFKMESHASMENLPMNSESGQSYGYIVYRKTMDISDGATLKAGPVKDFGMLLIDGKLQPTGYQTSNYWINEDTSFIQRKGLDGDNGWFSLNGENITDIEIIALEFKSKWVNSIVNLQPITSDAVVKGPAILQTSFEIDQASDTFLDMSEWHKGIVFVNGFNIGRYFKVGHQQTLYVPGPLLLVSGMNTITVFEQLEPAAKLKFKAKPNLGPETKRRTVDKDKMS